MNKDQCARKWNPSSVPTPPADTHAYSLGDFAYALFVLKAERREAKLLEKPLRWDRPFFGRLVASASNFHI